LRTVQLIGVPVFGDLSILHPEHIEPEGLMMLAVLSSDRS
jgi:hypothetical protein